MSDSVLTPSQLASRIKQSPVGDMMDAVLSDRIALKNKQLLKVQDAKAFFRLRAQLDELNFLRSILTNKGLSNELLSTTSSANN